jgi:hypothetical protein
MEENQDLGASGFEDRIRELFEDGSKTRAVSAGAVIRGARRRRLRHRAAVAGSSLAVVGVTAGAIALAGHTAAASRTTVTPVATPTTPKPTPPPKTCSASVTGTVPATTSSTIERLNFDTITGTTAGIPWAVQIHVFPNAEAHQAWMNGKPAGTYPPGASGAFHPGQILQIRDPDIPGYMDLGAPDGSPEWQFFNFGSGIGIGAGTQVDPSKLPAGVPKNFPVDSYKAYRVLEWMDPKVDHLCLQYEARAEFVPVYRIQGGAFMAFGYVPAEKPQELLGYDVTGQVVGIAKVYPDPMEGMAFRSLTKN